MCKATASVCGRARIQTQAFRNGHLWARDRPLNLLDAALPACAPQRGPEPGWLVAAVSLNVKCAQAGAAIDETSSKEAKEKRMALQGEDVD